MVYLINIADHIRKLEEEVIDAEWEGDPRSEFLARELEYYKEQAAKGEIYEPCF